MAGTTLLFSEVLDRVHKAKTKDQKVKILKDNNTPSKMLLENIQKMIIKMEETNNEIKDSS